MIKIGCVPLCAWAGPKGRAGGRGCILTRSPACSALNRGPPGNPRISPLWTNIECGPMGLLGQERFSIVFLISSGRRTTHA